MARNNVITTISLPPAVRDTMKRQGKIYRGGASAYLESLLLADFNKNNVKVRVSTEKERAK